MIVLLIVWLELYYMYIGRFPELVLSIEKGKDYINFKGSGCG